MWILLIFCAVLAALVIAQADPGCSQKLDRGKACKKNSTIRWYYDASSVECYPFKFNGCGGNGNNFKDHTTCFQSCNPSWFMGDPQSCPGGHSITSCELEITPRKPQCPKGTYCNNGYPVGLCCSEKLRDIAEAEEKKNAAVCPKGKKVVKYEDSKDWFIPLIVRGKRCEHEFCPKGSKCVQKKTAFCCQ